MKQGGQQTAHGGFTIVETLIVFAVTGLLFVAAILLISGRQAKAEFTTSINSLEQQLQQIINETDSGYYPNSGNEFVCSGASHPVSLVSGSQEQGTNSGCIFLGKAIQFGLDTDSSKLGVIPVVGNQYTAGTDPIETLSEASPVAAYNKDTITGSVETLAMQYGLTVASNSADCGGTAGMCYKPVGGGAAQKVGLIAFLSGDASGTIAASTGGGLKSGGQQLTLYAVKNSQPAQSYTDAANQIANFSNLAVADSVSICVASGTTSNQTGLITIDSGLRVSLVIKGNASCA